MMSKFEICLNTSVNGIPFGSERAAVREALGGKYKEFKKSKFSKNTTDDFGTCHVFYSSDDRFDAIEIFSEAAISVDSNSIPLACPALIAWVKDIDPEAAEDSDGIISKKLSMFKNIQKEKYVNIIPRDPRDARGKTRIVLKSVQF